MMNTHENKREYNPIIWATNAFNWHDVEWGYYDERRFRYFIYMHYYHNTIYSTINNILAQRYKAEHKLYKFIRGIHNPVERLVEIYVAHLYGGNINFDTLLDGAIPFSYDDNKTLEDLTTILYASNWQYNKELFVRLAAIYGDVFLHIVDETDNVYIEVIDPNNVEYVVKDENNEITEARIAYVSPDDNTKVIVAILNKETLSYYSTNLMSYKPFKVLDNSSQLMDSYPNPYGFVPLVHIKFKDVGKEWGVNAFNAQIPKIDEINDLGTLLDDNVRNTVQTLYHLKGGTGTQITSNINDATRDDIRVIYAQGEFQSLGNSLNIQGALAAIDSLKNELANDLPALALAELREQANLTAPGVRAAYTDGIKRLRVVQGSLDLGFSKALAMALGIASYRNILNGYDLEYYKEDKYNFSIKDRVIVEEKLSKDLTIQYLLQLTPDNPMLPLILETMGFTSNAIEDANERANNIQRTNLNIELVRQRNTLLEQLNNTGNVLTQEVNNNSDNTNNDNVEGNEDDV